MNHLASSIAVGCLLLLNVQFAYGQCQEETRTVTLSKDNVALLKSAVCKADASDAGIKVEQYRFSDAAASMITLGGTPKTLTSVIGRFQTAKNDVLKSYSDLLSKFGQTTVLKGDYTAWVEMPGEKEDVPTRELSELRGTKLRTLMGDAATGSNIDYPAIEEIRQLRSKVIPPNIAFFNEVTCDDVGESPKVHDDKNKCFKFDPAKTTTLFWRSMDSADVSSYRDRAKQYNLQLGRKHRDDALDLSVPRELKFYEYISNGAWPKDFVILSGYRMEDGCGEDSSGGIAGWRFGFNTRAVYMDATSIENLGKKPITIDRFIGASSTDSKLRPLSSSLEGAQRLNVEPTTLAPGERILIPIRIVFVSGDADQFSYGQTAEQLFTSRGNQGFSGNSTTHGAPDLKDFVFGPEISISAISTANQTINFQETVKTALNVTISSESGSCPYLLFRESSDEWISSGKILQAAKGATLESSEIVTFTGLVSQFRLEEREPEVAQFRGATLTLRLKNGDALTLTPSRPFDRNGLQLLWGDTFEFSFNVPKSITRDTVMESRLEITGYYDRYSKIMASNSGAEMSTFGKPESSAACKRNDIRGFVRRVLR
jgi:hypothetical protein